MGDLLLFRPLPGQSNQTEETAGQAKQGILVFVADHGLFAELASEDRCWPAWVNHEDGPW